MNEIHACPSAGQKDDSHYRQEHRRSLAEPRAFWAEQARHLHWHRPWDEVLDESRAPLYRWFAGAEFNTCYNALDRHVEGGRAEQAALIYDSPVSGRCETYSYRELRDLVARFAGCLRALGVERSDRVVIYMPMVPEALIAMLACARIGAVHSVVFGGFAAPELAKRIEDAQPKLVVTASCGIEPTHTLAYKPLLDEAIRLAAAKPDACLIHQRPQLECPRIEGRDRDWAQEVARARAEGRTAECVSLAATDPLYVLYTSGTTGKPKGVVRDNGGHMVALKWSMSNFFGVAPGEVFWAASDVGWVVGHSYIVYGPLLHGCTAILYEGKPVGTPDAGAYWRVISEHGVVTLFTAPTAFRAIKKEDPKAELLRNYDISSFRALFLAGERADPDTVKWAEDILKTPVIDHWWQTETGWPMVGNPLGLGALPVKHGSPTVPLPGYRIEVLDEGGKPVPPGTMGALVVRLPLPPGALPTLWQAEDRFKEAYLSVYPGYYSTSDAGYIDEDGYVWVMGRTDDIINVAGHRLSTGGMEEVLASHQAVAECAVIGMKDPLKGEVPCGFVVLKSGVNRPQTEIEAELVALVREKIGPVAAFRLAITVPRLPKTRSGKILRGTMKKIADGDAWNMPATIDDPMILDEIGEVLKSRGVAG